MLNGIILSCLENIEYEYNCLEKFSTLDTVYRGMIRDIARAPKQIINGSVKP